MNIPTTPIPFTRGDRYDSNYRAKYETEGYEIVMIAKPSWKTRNTRLVIVGDGEQKVDFNDAYAMGELQESGLRRGVNKEMDRLFDHLNNQVKRNKRAVIDGGIAEDEGLAGILAGVEIRWSNKAGCSCPCSPGFVTSKANNFVKTQDGSTVVVTDIYITKKAE